MTKCVRCGEEFQQLDHSMAHFFTICYECRNQRSETLEDQKNFNEKNWIVGLILPPIF